jgi:hypothetical protein
MVNLSLSEFEKRIKEIQPKDLAIAAAIFIDKACERGAMCIGGKACLCPKHRRAKPSNVKGQP